MRRFVVYLMVIAGVLLSAMSAGAQSNVAHGYEFTYGTDTTRWINIDAVSISQDLSYNAQTVQLPFDFTLYNRTVSTVTLCRGGTMLFGSFQHMDFPPFPSGMDVAGIWGLGTNRWCRIHRRWCSPPDSTGGRIYVFQFEISSGTFSSMGTEYYCWQVQLHENDNSITLVYKRRNPAFSSNTQGLVGLQLGYGRYIVVSPSYSPLWNRVWTSFQDNVVYTGWPGEYRYYRFVPIDTVCPPPAVIGASGSWQNLGTVQLLWHRCDRHGTYRVEYGPAGFDSGTGTVINTADTHLTITGLAAGTDYEARISAACTDSLFSHEATIEFRAPCPPSSDNQIPFYDLNAGGVVCYTGTTSSPSSSIGVVDSGSLSPLSHHTVHCNPLERDFHTAWNLYTVPDGHCASVRLGNWNNGAEQESVTYTLYVDTDDYDLLVLRYALVEEDPSHVAANQPQFEFDITDIYGGSISSCYHSSFVSGDLSGWQHEVGNILWRDWDAVGVDLAPMHGQTIHVTLSNRDCAQSGHFGYGYFTLESAHKHFRSTSCGEVDENTFRAPEGFAYRWYNAADTVVTLSTADTLRVTDTGMYCCRVSHHLSSQECSFVMTTYMGSRYPMASFTYDSGDSCGMLVRFQNHSVIARDSVHTQLTTYPCERYLWRFDDGSTSTDPNPVHLYHSDGLHTVTLYAMLADSACVDSVSSTFYLDLARDTVYDTVCAGQPYMFYGVEIDQPGIHSILDSCQVHVLFLHHLPKYDHHIFDTLTVGETYTFDGHDFTTPAKYQRRYTSTDGCDSVVTLHLCSREERYHTICSSSLPYTWEGVTFTQGGCDTVHFVPLAGTDSIIILHLGVRQPPVASFDVEHFCNDSTGYFLLLADTLCYSVSSVPPDGVLQFGSTILLQPSVTTTYIVATDYCDTVSCPRVDNLELQPIHQVDAHLFVEPSFLTENVRDITAFDLSTAATGRQWYVNTELQGDDSVLHYCLIDDADSVCIMLVANNDYCTDTVEVSIPVKIQSLWFPNVFTPNEPTNNIFKGYGTNVRDYDLWVYTRWGHPIFHTTDINEGWDGTFHGIKSPVSAYVYLCHYTTLEGEPRTVAGTVSLVR